MTVLRTKREKHSNELLETDYRMIVIGINE